MSVIILANDLESVMADIVIAELLELAFSPNPSVPVFEQDTAAAVAAEPALADDLHFSLQDNGAGLAEQADEQAQAFQGQPSSSSIH